MSDLRQSTAATIILGPFNDATDGVTPETGLATAMDNATTGIRLNKNGALDIDRNSATSPIHDIYGDYTVTLDATDTNTLGILRVKFADSAVNTPAWKDFMVMPTNVWDSLYGTDALDVNTIQVAGTTQTAEDLGNSVAAILLDTAELQQDWVNGGRLDLILDIIAADTTTDIPATITTLTTNVATVDTEVGNIQTDLDNGTDGLGALKTVLDLIVADTGTDGVVISVATAQIIADELLKRDWNSVTGEAARSTLNALRFLRNKFSISGGTLTVTEEDDSTTAWTSALTTDAAADPVTASDPA